MNTKNIHASPQTLPRALDLSGTWHAALDPDRVGEREAWPTLSLAERGTAVQLPGSAQLQGLGTPPDLSTAWVGDRLDHPFYTADRYAPYRDPADFRVPFWLQPDLVYTGAVWYQRTIVLDAPMPAATLVLERVHWESTLWVDGVRIGSDRSLSTPHRYGLDALSAGEHVVTVRVDNAMIVDVGTNAHSVSDHTQGGWNGIIGTMELVPASAVRLGPLEVTADPRTRTIRVRGTITADSLGGAEGLLTLAAAPLRRDTDTATAPAPAPIALPALTVPFTVERERFRRGRDTTASTFDVEYPLGEQARLWDEFDPCVYELTARIGSAMDPDASSDERRTVFGLRSVVAVGTQIHVNDRPVFLRGTLECCVFPLTGHPPTDVAEWTRVYDVVRAYGLNHVRFHSWCPPEAAFVAADLAGILLQVEGPIWANQGAAIGEGRDVDAYIHEESQRIVEEFGNHPSFVLMAHGNEPNGRDVEFLTSWVSHWRGKDPRRLYTSAGGWPALAVSDFDCIPEPRVQAWGEGLGSRINGRPPETETDYHDWVERTPRPIVTHEAGQWCVYPNPAEIDSYTGIMKAQNIRIVEDFLDQAGLLDRADEIVHATGRLQVLCYKEEVESALRTAGFGGIQLLGLNDFPGQGTAPVGVVDAFWHDKGYTDGAEFSRFFSSTVPLALLPRRTFRADEALEAAIKIAHFGPAPLESDIEWSIVDDDGRVLDRGRLSPGTIAIGNTEMHGRIRAGFAGVTRAQRVRLIVSLDAGTHRAENDWELWVYPVAPEAGATTGPLVTRDVDEALVALDRGETVLLVPERDRLASPVEFGFSPVFWNVDWTNGQAPHTLGILCDPEHPAFASFPTDAHTNWQWWELLHDAVALELTGAAAEAEPLVRVIDSWFDVRHLGVLIEARVGRGRLLLSAMDVVTDLDERLVARQLRASLTAYLDGTDFRPGLALTPQDVVTLLGGPAR